MNCIRVGAAALNQTPLDWRGNLRRIRAAIREARSQGVSILLTPELSITGYGCEDAFFSKALLERAKKALKELAPESKGMFVAVGLPFESHGALYNGMAALADGELLGVVAKRHLAGDGVHYEPRWFKPWQSALVVKEEWEGQSVPIGDILFEYRGATIGFEICEDAWVPQRLSGELSRKGCDIILNPSASHFAFGKHEVRKRIVLEGSRAGLCTYVHTNLLGCEAGRILYDGGILIASGGDLLVEADRFSFHEYTLASAVVDLERTRSARRRLISFLPLEGVRVTSEKKSRNTSALSPSPVIIPDSPSSKFEEFSRALPLALFDYLRKSRSHGFVLSLSGGADSSTLVVLIAMMVRLGIKDLGIPGFHERLPYLKNLPKREKDLTRTLLTSVYQRTKNSSAITEEAARSVAKALGSEFHVFDVDTFFDDYVALVSKSVGRKLTWGHDDIALQNIQARVRSPSIWLLANVKQALLLVTSNRSEAAVGYCTMDGDTSGSIAPLGGIDKATLREWLLWMEREGPEWFGPVPELSLVNHQQPTAELRPHSAKQTDEGDLMPYVVLDMLEKWAVRDKKGPLEVFQFAVSALKNQYSRAVIKGWVIRFFTLWCRSQWKRERYAPSFHLDDENLDPKTWCRFPILSGGYEEELDELKRS